MEKQTKLLFFFCLLRPTCQDPLSCRSSCSTQHSMEWPDTPTDTLALSTPLCLDETWEFLYRKCSNGLWAEEPHCVYVQEPIRECPDEFTAKDSICYVVVNNTPFPPVCPYEDFLPFNKYKDIILVDEPIWLPVTRDTRNGLGFLQWVEPSSLYKSDYKDVYYVNGTLKGKNCLLLNNSTVVATACNETYSAVCAYKKLYDITNPFCPSAEGESSCKQSDFSPKSKCFCVGGADKNQSSYRKAEFVRSHQNNVYWSLTSDNCTIGLERVSNGSYVWVNSQQEITYSYWSTDAIFDPSNIYGIATMSGWLLSKEPVSCFLYEIEIEPVTASLELRYLNDNDTFQLTITNPQGIKYADSNPLIFCFTDASAFNLVYRYNTNMMNNYTRDENDVLVYEFTPHIHGPGNYWCEAFTYPNLTTIQTDTHFYKNKAFGPEYIAILSLNYVDGTNPLSSNITEFLERVLCLTLNLTRYTSRVMKIEDVDEEDNLVVVNVHFTCVNHVAKEAEDDEFQQLMQKINESLAELPTFNIEIKEFLSPDYCAAEIDNDLYYWPKTNVENSWQALCFLEDGTRFRRHCSGDFVSGARWQPVENCTVANTSGITPKLMELEQSDATDHEKLNTIIDILENLQDFHPVDIYLTGNILSETNRSLGEELVEIIFSLMQTDRETLKSSQQKMKAVDILLDILLTIKGTVNVTKSNFVFLSQPVREVNGVVLLRNGGFNILNKKSQEEIQQIGDIECGIWLDPQLIDNMGDVNAIFIFFRDDIFFQEDGAQEIGNIFGTMLPQNKDKFLVSTIHRISTRAINENHCVSWSYGNFQESNSWKETGNSTTSSPFVMCEFSQVGYFALETNGDDSNESSNNDDDDHVTLNLQKILDSISNPADIIGKLLIISQRYHEFNSTDVYLVGKILEKVEDDEHIDLAALATIISNVHGIERAVLMDSQLQHRATDIILHAVDSILLNHEYDSMVNITADNFFILIADLNETNLAALVLLDYNETFQLEVVLGDVTVDEIAEYPNLDSGLVISPDLKNQLGEDGKVVVTVFSNDSLFNEETSRSRYVSKIFGVILPDVGNYSGPISMVHRVGNGYREQCVHWAYDRTNSVAGTWRKDHDGEDLSEVVHCEFWHTTHFALILLDKDKYANDLDFLDWITAINCALSLFGTSCIILTAAFFKTWRMNTGNQVLLHFVLAIILQIGIFYASATINRFSDDYLLCTIIGASLHYSIVSQFCWMFIIAVLQFKRFVEVLGGPPKYVLLKACLCGWVLPLLPVACVFFLDESTYVSGNVGLCYPSGLGLYLGVWLPVAIVVAINFVIFVYIMYSVFHRKTECGEVANNEAMFQWRLAVLLFFMLGLTWTFGFLSELDFGVIFVYLFCFSATLQGFVMFLFFILFNKNTRYLYTQAFRKCCHTKHY